jgi:thiosulfate/3-mercaptopyruvate sulfurtransferase
MQFNTLITTEQLANNLDNQNWAIFDCRFDLADTDKGRRSYLHAHIPGAVYVHLDEHLSAPVVPGVTGRHPLPPLEEIEKTFSTIGIDSSVQAVAYDDAGGALAAGRLWWMLRYLGHERAAVLDGGWKKWVLEQRPVRGGEEQRQPREFHGVPEPGWLLRVEQVRNLLDDPGYVLVDARAEERYRGAVEPIDNVAGHIPGALCLPYESNLREDCSFIPVELLREKFRNLVGDIPAHRVVFYCGSGVTSIHHILAMEHAGMGIARLYLGSWSEWITDPERPIETGSTRDR